MMHLQSFREASVLRQWTNCCQSFIVSLSRSSSGTVTLLQAVSSEVVQKLISLQLNIKCRLYTYVYTEGTHILNYPWFEVHYAWSRIPVVYITYVRQSSYCILAMAYCAHVVHGINIKNTLADCGILRLCLSYIQYHSMCMKCRFLPEKTLSILGKLL